MSEKNDNILGQNIRSHRKRNNLTQKELGEKLNVSASAVRMWEKNGNRPPLETLKRAADIFNISFAELVGYDEGITVESLTQKERTIIGYYRSKEHIRNLRTITDIAAPCIAIAHGFGRIGCLMAGCCYGAETDAWYGIHMQNIDKKVVPIQLFEALILFALFGLFLYRVLKGRTYNLPLYMAVYGIWRFLIEYARDDYRGYTFISFLTPSQLTAIAMIIGAAILFAVMKISVKKEQSGETL